MVCNHGGVYVAAARGSLGFGILLCLSTDVIHTRRCDPDDEQEAIEILQRYQDRKFSFTDCITSALMKRDKFGEDIYI